MCWRTLGVGLWDLVSGVRGNSLTTTDSMSCFIVCESAKKITKRGDEVATRSYQTPNNICSRYHLPSLPSNSEHDYHRYQRHMDRPQHSVFDSLLCLRMVPDKGREDRSPRASIGSSHTLGGGVYGNTSSLDHILDLVLEVEISSSPHEI